MSIRDVLIEGEGKEVTVVAGIASTTLIEERGKTRERVWVCITNPFNRNRMIRSGVIIGTVVDATEVAAMVIQNPEGLNVVETPGSRGEMAQPSEEGSLGTKESEAMVKKMEGLTGKMDGRPHSSMLWLESFSDKGVQPINISNTDPMTLLTGKKDEGEMETVLEDVDMEAGGNSYLVTPEGLKGTLFETSENGEPNWWEQSQMTGVW